MYLDLDNVPFYVGKGKDDRYYVSMHLAKDRPNSFLQNKIRKVGVDNVKIHFLHENISEKEAFSWESYWIKYIGRRDKGEGSLCNLTDGGEGSSGHTVSKETRQKISAANKGRFAGANHPMYGRSHTKETKQKIGAANKGENHPMYGKSHTKETKQKMSEVAEGKKIPDETKRKIGATLKGHIISDETKQKISATKKGVKNFMYGKSHTKETKQKMRDAWKLRRNG